MLSITFLVLSCNERTANQNTTKIVQEEVQATPNDQAVKAWLIKNITDYFAVQELDSLNIMMQNMTTPDYYEYKGDATNVDLYTDDALNEQEFYQKWKDKFDTKNAGIGVGFLITGQDWGTIIVNKCDLQSQKDGQYIFDVNIHDSDFKQDYPITVTVISTDNGFRIADIKQPVE